jgi:hypothetical protein
MVLVSLLRTTRTGNAMKKTLFGSVDNSALAVLFDALKHPKFGMMETSKLQNWSFPRSTDNHPCLSKSLFSKPPEPRQIVTTTPIQRAKPYVEPEMSEKTSQRPRHAAGGRWVTPPGQLFPRPSVILLRSSLIQPGIPFLNRGGLVSD